MIPGTVVRACRDGVAPPSGRLVRERNIMAIGDKPRPYTIILSSFHTSETPIGICDRICENVQSSVAAAIGYANATALSRLSEGPVPVLFPGVQVCR